MNMMKRIIGILIGGLAVAGGLVMADGLAVAGGLAMAGGLVVVVAQVRHGSKGRQESQVQEAKDYNHFRTLEVMNESGDYEKALVLLGKQLQGAPGNVKTLVFRCQLNRDLGRYGDALTDINSAIKNNNRKSGCSEASLHRWKAWVYDAMDDRDGNMRNLELVYSAARKNRKNEGENYAKICHNYCDKLTRAGRDVESLAICRELMKGDESDIVAASLAARNMLAAGDAEGGSEASSWNIQGPAAITRSLTMPR